MTSTGVAEPERAEITQSSIISIWTTNLITIIQIASCINGLELEVRIMAWFLFGDFNPELFWLITIPASCRRAGAIANNEPLDHKNPYSNINP